MRDNSFQTFPTLSESLQYISPANHQLSFSEYQIKRLDIISLVDDLIV